MVVNLYQNLANFIETLLYTRYRLSALPISTHLILKKVGIIITPTLHMRKLKLGEHK